MACEIQEGKKGQNFVYAVLKWNAGSKLARKTEGACSIAC